MDATRQAAARSQVHARRKQMDLTALAIPGLKIIEPQKFGDERRCLFARFSQQGYAGEIGIALAFV